MEVCQCATRRAPMDFFFLYSSMVRFTNPLHGFLYVPLNLEPYPVLPSLIVARFNAIMTTFSPPSSYFN